MFGKRRLTVSGASGDPSGSKKRRTVDCVKILLDITKESADSFPFLKSALGGINALIKHYEEFKDVREKIEGLIPQLERFKQIVTTTVVNEDPEETTRRARLVSTFNQIEELSKKLLEKSAITRFADKGKDSKVVAGLVEQLREAIVYYQVSQQQAIYHQITHLTSSFEAFLKLQEKPSMVTNKLEFVIARLKRLEDTSWSELQNERSAKLFDDLRPIWDRTKVLCERVAAEGYVDAEGDAAAVSGLAEELRDILLEYWMLQQQDVYDQNRMLIVSREIDTPMIKLTQTLFKDAADLSVLNNCRRAQGAQYRYGNRRGCLKGTRETVLNEIESWAKDFSVSPVFWLNGLAGTGKSTIAQTVAGRIFVEERLGASFFCSRDFEDRRNLHFIFPTLAFQLAHKYPDFRSYFVSLRSDPDVVHDSLYGQMERLIVKPLQTIGVSTVIIIDALDECKDDEPSSAILSVLGRFVDKVPRVKFFITGRPEPRINTGFRLPLLVDSTDVFVLHDVHPSLINSDIRLFLKHELSEVARRRRLGAWPSDEHIDLLCRRAAGLFIYAVATVKLLDSNTHLPKHRLSVILNLPESTVPEGRTRFNPKTTLDSLYTSILQTAFSEDDPDVYFKVRSTIGAVVLVVNPLPPSAIAELVGLEPEEVILFLTLVQSLLAMGEDFSQPVKPFYKSFPDFIVDPSRCTDARFHVSPELLQSELSSNCLRVMNSGLEPNLLSLPEYALNLQVTDLQARIDNQVSITLQYACRSWHNHLPETGGDLVSITSHLRIFLETKFLAWLEVLSVLGDVGGGATALKGLMTWLRKIAKDSDLLDTTRDCFYFVTKFFEPIKASANHVYHSALELCPASSIVRKLYYHSRHHVIRLPRVLAGAPNSWDPIVSISNKDYGDAFCAWSPCGQFVAVQTHSVVEIRNQLTFELLTVLQPAEATRLLVGALAYSPDGRSLACASDIGTLIWDIQTGGVARVIEREEQITSLVWSSDGRLCATSFGNEAWHVHTDDFALSRRLPVEGLEEWFFVDIQAHEGSFFVTMARPEAALKPRFDESLIDIFEVGRTVIKVHSLRITMGWKPGYRITFSPTTRRISVTDRGSLRILDCQGQALELLSHGAGFSYTSFSSDASLFAASKEGGVYLWKYTYHRYSLLREFWCRGSASFLQFSPTQFPAVVLARYGNVLQMWRLEDVPFAPPPPCQQYAALSRPGNHIVTAYKLETTLTIVNLHSPTISQFVDTGVEIEGLALTGNILLAVGSGRAVAWMFLEGGLVGSTFGSERAGRAESIWTRILPQLGSDLWTFSVEGQLGVLRLDEDALVIYHTETGEVVKPIYEATRWKCGPRNPQSAHALGGGQDYLCCNNPSLFNMPPEGGWQPSQSTLQEAWLKDPEGRHRLWVPVEWRESLRFEKWSHNFTTLFASFKGSPVIIRF